MAKPLIVIRGDRVWAGFTMDSLYDVGAVGSEGLADVYFDRHSVAELLDEQRRCPALPKAGAWKWTVLTGDREKNVVGRY